MPYHGTRGEIIPSTCHQNMRLTGNTNYQPISQGWNKLQHGRCRQLHTSPPPWPLVPHRLGLPQGVPKGAEAGPQNQVHSTLKSTLCLDPLGPHDDPDHQNDSYTDPDKCHSACPKYLHPSFPESTVIKIGSESTRTAGDNIRFLICTVFWKVKFLNLAAVAARRGKRALQSARRQVLWAVPSQERPVYFGIQYPWQWKESFSSTCPLSRLAPPPQPLW